MNEEVQNYVESNTHRQEIAAYIQSRLQPVARTLEKEATSTKETTVPETPQFEVRDYQLDAWGTLWDARQNGATSGLIHLATGLGKTSVAVFDVIKFREDYFAQHGRMPRVLFATHMDDINTQAAERFASFMPDVHQGVYNAKRKERDKPITFATLQSLYSSLDTFDPAYFDYIVYDEAHHGKAKTFEAVIKHFRPQFQLALTATPNRADGLDIRELFGEKLYSKGLADAIAEGYLADVDYHIVFDEAVKALIASGFAPESLKALKELLSVPPRNESVVQSILEEKKRIGMEDAKTVIFCEGITHAGEMAELMGGKAYHSDVKKELREGILAEFKIGNNTTICAVDMLNEGIDIPDARVIVFLRSTQSPTVFEQQLGRGLRRLLGKDRVSVLDFAANIERIEMVRSLAQQIKHRRDALGVTKEVEELEKWLGQVSGELPNDKDYSDLLNVRTGHAEFTFDTMAVDLLERYRQLLAQAGQERMGSISLHALAGELHSKAARLQRLAVKLGVPVIEERGSLRVTLQNAALLREELNVLPAPLDWVTVSRFLGRLPGFGEGGLRLAMEALGLHERWMLDPAGKKCQFLSPEEEQQVITWVAAIGLADDNWAAGHEAERELGIRSTKFERLAEEAGVTGSFRRNVQGRIATYYSVGDRAAVRHVLELERASLQAGEGRQLAHIIREHHIGRSTFQRLAKELGIKGTTQRQGLTEIPTYSDKQIRQVLELRDKIPAATTEDISFESLAQIFPGRHEGVKRALQATGIRGTQKRNEKNGKVGIYFSVEERARLYDRQL